MTRKSDNGAVVQILRLEDGSVVRCQILSMFERVFLIRDLSLPEYHRMRKIPISEVMYVDSSNEVLN